MTSTKPNDTKPEPVSWREWQSFERQVQRESQKSLSWLPKSLDLSTCQRAWQSFECQLQQQQPHSSQSDSHCLCPNCLEDRQETKTFPAKNKDHNANSTRVPLRKSQK